MHPLLQALLDRVVGPTPNAPQPPQAPASIIAGGPQQLAPDFARHMMDYEKKVLDTERELRIEAQYKQMKDPNFWSGALGTPLDQGLGESDEAYYKRNGAGVPGNRWAIKK